MLIAGQVKRRGDGPGRAGTGALSLLAVPLNAAVVQALAEGPRSLIDLRREAGSPPPTTMRCYLRVLAQTGVVEKRRRNEFPGNVEYQLTDSGRELLHVAGVLSAWLSTPPEGPTALGSGEAKSAISALVEGWSTSMVRALAVRPLSLTELASVITSVSYPSLERRLGAMRLAGLLERTHSAGRGRPYAVTEWMRRAIAPLAAAASWERRRMRDEAPSITNRDAESAFLLALPLLDLREGQSGSCHLGVRLARGGEAMAGVVALVREGKVQSCETHLESEADAWAFGSTGAWLTAVTQRDTDRLELGGDRELAAGLVEGLHGTLFGSTART